jgi:hypothetical protein
MMLKEHQINILLLAYELEKTLHELYELYTVQYPDNSTLWNILCKEEKEHAEGMQKLYQASYDGQCAFDEGNIKPEAMQSIVDYAKIALESARTGKLDACKAVTFACDIENSLIQKDIFRHFKVSSQFSDLLQTLHEQTKSHAQLAKIEREKFLF